MYLVHRIQNLFMPLLEVLSAGNAIYWVLWGILPVGLLLQRGIGHEYLTWTTRMLSKRPELSQERQSHFTGSIFNRVTAGDDGDKDSIPLYVEDRQHSAQEVSPPIVRVESNRLSEQDEDLMGMTPGLGNGTTTTTTSRSRSTRASTLGTTAVELESQTSFHNSDIALEETQFPDTSKAPFDKGNLLETQFLSTSPAQNPFVAVPPVVALNDHAPWKEVRTKLQCAVEEAYPKRYKSRYSSVKVLLMSWKAGSPSMKEELDRLQLVFETEFNFETEEFLIPDDQDDPVDEFTTKLQGFIGPGKHSLSETLFIFYYAGHGVRDENTGEHLWKAKNTDKSSSMDADLPINFITERSRARSFDALFLLDCCDPVPRKIQRKHNRSVCEVITACADMKALEACDDSFTSLLIHELYLASRSSCPLNTLQLYDKLVSRSQNAEPRVRFKQGKDGKLLPIRDLASGHPRIGGTRRIPLYRALSSDQKETHCSRHIELAPVPPTTNMPDDVGETRPGGDESLIDNIKSVMPPTEVVEVVIAISIEGDIAAEDLVDDLKSWICNAPPQATRVKTLQAIRSCSTLLIIQVPVAVWAAMEPSPAIRFVGFAKEDLPPKPQRSLQTHGPAHKNDHQSIRPHDDPRGELTPSEC